MKCKKKASSKDNLTHKLKQLKKHREKFEEQQEKQGCRYLYHRKAKSDVSDVSVAGDTATKTATMANVAKTVIMANSAKAADSADSIFDVKSSQAVAEAVQSSLSSQFSPQLSSRLSAKIATVINTPASKSIAEPETDMMDMALTNMAMTDTAMTSRFSNSSNSSNSSKFSKFVDVSKERPDKRFHRLEIWFADLGYHDWRCIEEGWHPVLIISNNANNEFTPIVTVAPITSKTNKLYLPGHVFIDATDVSDNGADIPNFSFRSGSVLLEQITVLDKRQLEKYAGKVISKERIGILNQAIISFLDLKG